MSQPANKPEQQVIDIMASAGINFTATLPCDRTKNLLPMIHSSFRGVRLTREEDGLGICAGAWLAGARPLMAIQSTGLGNMVCALASLNQGSGIPVPILASYRGFYKEKIASQMPLGRHLPGILSACGIPHTLIDEADGLHRISDVITDAFQTNQPRVALISPKVWEGSSCRAWEENPPLEITARSADAPAWPLSDVPPPSMTRYDAIHSLKDVLRDQAVVCNLGIPSKELYEIMDRDLNYYMLGSMGLASSIGLGLALSTQRRVMVLDGDGSILMNPNALITIGRYLPSNLMILALDNGVYGSTGSQNTFTRDGVDLEQFARCCGFRHTRRVSDGDGLSRAVRELEDADGCTFIHAVLKTGNAACPNIPLELGEITARFRAAL